MAIKCSLEPALASALINDYLYFNPKPQSLPTFYKDIAKILFDAEGDLRSVVGDYKVGDETSNFGSYLRRLSGVVKGQIAVLGSEFERGESDYDTVDVNAYTLADNIGRSVMDKIAREDDSLISEDIAELAQEEKAPVPDPIEAVEVVSSQREHAISFGKSTAEFYDFVASYKKTRLQKDDLDFETFADTYFGGDLITLFDDFKAHFLNNFSDALIDTRVVNGQARGYNDNIISVLENLKLAVEDAVDEDLLESTEASSLLDTNPATRRAYFNKVIANNFDNVVKLYLDGVNIGEGLDKATLDIAEGRKGFTDFDGGHSGLATESDAMKMLIYTTPRLTKDEHGNIVQDDNKPTLGDHEVKAVANVLNSFPRTAEGFRDKLENRMNSKDINADIYRSLHHRFFSDENYTVDGVTRKSVYAIFRDNNDKNANNMVSLLMTSFHSQQHLSYIIAKNGNVTRTNPATDQLSSSLKEDFTRRISDVHNKSELDPTIADKISVEDVDGVPHIKIANGKGQFVSFGFEVLSTKKSDGIPVRIDEEGFKEYSNETKALNALHILGFPPSLTSNFIKHYKQHIGAYAAQSTIGTERDLSLPNMIANMAYMIAMNKPEALEKMVDMKVALPKEHKSTEESTLAFPPMDSAHRFVAPIKEFIAIAEGAGVKKKHMDNNGNFVSNIGVKARIHDTENNISDIRDRLSNGETTVHARNVLVSEKYDILGTSYKDGFEIMGNVRSNSSMSKAEQYRYIIEDLYVKIGAQEGFKVANFQSAVMSDRSRVETMITRKNQGEYLDPHKLDTARSSMIEAQKDFHNDLASAITTSWVTQLQEWSKKGNSFATWNGAEVDAISTIEELNTHLAKYPVPIAAAKAGRHLANRVMYVADENKNAKIKDVFMYMRDTFNDPNRADKFVQDQLRKFRNQLKKEGYTPKTMSDDVTKILRNRFGQSKNYKIYDMMLESFFFESNIIANAATSLSMGSLYQFKGDMDHTKEMDFATDLVQRFAERNDEQLTTDQVRERATVKAKEIASGRALNSMFVDQAKRNAGLGSGFHHPRLFSSFETGTGLDEFTNTAVIDDPEIAVDILGTLGQNGQEVYDAAQFAHPLYFLKLNNSLGNEMSQYMTQGGAVKDISNELDPVTGVLRFQKKATFNQFSTEMLTKGTPELARLFRKMNSSITFKGEITYKGETIPVKNLQELWEHFGATKESHPNRIGEDKYANAWESVLEVLGQNPENRSAYIEKVGFTSGEKTGSRALNKTDVWSTDGAPLKYTKFSNEQHGVILNADHDPDSTHTEHGEKSLMTQAISAAVFQGESFGIAENINDALLSLSEASLDRIKTEIDEKAVDLLRKMANTNHPTLKGQGLAVQALTNNSDRSDAEEQQVQSLIIETGLDKTAMKEYALDLTKDALVSKDTFNIVSKIANHQEYDGMDTMQLQNEVHRAVMAHLNRETVRIKFKGQEFVVSTAHDFAKLYELPNGNVVSRDDFMKSTQVKFDEITNTDDLKATTDYDIIEFNGVEMQLWEAIAMKGDRKSVMDGNTVGIKRLPAKDKQRNLKWLGYNGVSPTTGEPVKLTDTSEFKDLKANGKELANRETTTERQKELLADRVPLELAFKELMNNTAYQWETEDAEFYMPQTHMAAFNLDINSNISEIMGDLLTGEQISVDGGEVVYESQLASMRAYFEDQIYDVIDTKKEYRDIFNFTKSYDELTIGGLDKISRAAARKLSSIDPNSELASTLEDELEHVKQIMAEALQGAEVTEDNSNGNLDNNLLDKFNTFRESNRKMFVEDLANRQAKSFPKTLKILAARIPGTGKQSYVAGKVKGFITSQRNGIWGPAEMLTITGADHDIDKAHVLVYSVDSEGVVYSYDSYLDASGKISREVYGKNLANKIEIHKKRLSEAGKSPRQVDSIISEFRKNENLKFKEAIKNYIIDGLRTTSLDPRNAVESATPVSLEKLKKAIKTIEKEEKSEEQDEDGSVITGGQFMSPFNPASIPNLEIINAVGKQAVGVYATGLKGYAAIYTASLKDMTSEHIKFPDFTRGLFASDDKAAVGIAQDLFKKFYGRDSEGNAISNNTLNLFVTDGKGVKERHHRSLIANTDKWAEGVNPDDPKFKEQAQAWADISELTNAATDNAKELILGRIGADGNTNGLIAAAVTAGFDLTHVLALLQDPDVKDVLKAVERGSDTVNTQPELPLKFAINDHMRRKFGWFNKGFYSSVKSLQGTIKALEGTRPDAFKSAEIAILDIGTTNIEDLKILAGGAYSTNDYDLATTNVESSTPTDLELSTLQRLAAASGTDFNTLNKSKATAMLRSFTDSKTLIIPTDQNLSSVNIRLAAAYAASTKKELFQIQPDGSWSKFDGDMFMPSKNTPLFTKSTAIFTNSKLSAPARASIKRAISETKMAIANPAEYNKTISTRRKGAHKSKLANADQALKDKMEEFVGDGPRQLLMLMNMAKENRAVTSLLAINQSIPNGDYDVYKYFNAFIKNVNGAAGGPFIGLDELYKFISDLQSPETMPEADALIEQYEGHKTAVNPFYVIKQNSHYFGYIKSLKLGMELVRSGTFTNKAIEELIKKFTDGNVDEEAYSSIKNMVYGIGVEQFFQKRGPLRVAGTDYDLGTNDGRADFMSEMVNITKKVQREESLENNPFVKALWLDEIKDVQLRDFFTVVRTNDIGNMEPHTIAKLRVGLNNLRESHPEFHDALFYYSLVLHKGAKGKNSFASLFDANIDGFKDYVKFLDGMDAKNIMDAVAKMHGSRAGGDAIDGVAFSLINRTMKRMDTRPKSGYKGAGSNSVHDQHYVLPNPEAKKAPSMFMSKQTGKIYHKVTEIMFNGKPLDYVVVTSKYPVKGIPYTTSEMGVEAAGYQYGETAELSGTKVQVLKYQDFEKNYLVDMGNGVIVTVNRDTLEENNPDMIFSGRNFGPIVKKDRLNPDFDRTAILTKPNVQDWPVSFKEVEEIEAYSMKYQVITDVPEGAEPGKVIGYAERGGFKARVRYLGNMGYKRHIAMGLASKKDKAAYAYFNEEVDGAHIVEFEPVSTPNKPVIALDSVKKRPGGSILTRVGYGRAVNFASTEDIDVEEGETKLMEVRHPKTKATQFFKVTNVGPSVKYIGEQGILPEEMHDRMGYTGKSGFNTIRKIMAPSSEFTMYTVEPYNGKQDNTNSHLEYRFLSDEATPINDVQINLVGATNNHVNADIIAKMGEFGVSAINEEEETFVTDEKFLEESMLELGKVYPNAAKSTSDYYKKSANVVLNSDMTIIVSDFDRLTSDEQEAANYDPSSYLDKELEKLVKIVGDNFEGDVTDSLDKIVADIQAGTLSTLDGNKLRRYSTDLAKLRRDSGKASVVRKNPGSAPASVKTKTFKNFVAAQVAKHAGKNLHIYSPSRQQWFQYEPNTGEYIPTSIPIMEGTVAYFDDKPNDDIGKQGLDSLLKKTAVFARQQDGGLGTLKRPANLTFGSEPDSELNTPTLSPSPLSNVNGISEIELDGQVVVDGIVYKGTEINGETYTKNHFTDFENATVNEMPDGSITIESTTTGGDAFFWAAFPDANVRKNYANFTGDSVKEDFKVQIDGKYYIFDELHRTNKQAFERRDQLIEEKLAIDAAFDSVQTVYDEEVGPKYAAIRFKDVKSREQFKHFPGYKAFMQHLRIGTFTVDASPEDIKALLDADNQFKMAHAEAWKVHNKVVKSNTKTLPNVSGVSESFYNMDKSYDEAIVVYLSDFSGKPANSEEGITKVYGKSYVNTKFKGAGKQVFADKQVRSFALPVIGRDKKGNITSNTQKAINKYVGDIIRLANSTDKTIYFEGPSKVSTGDRMYNGVDSIEVMKAVAKGFANNKVKGLPNNLVFTNNSAEIMNRYKDGMDPDRINTVLPFSVTRDATVYNSYDIRYYRNLSNFTVGEATLASLWKQKRNYKELVEVSTAQPALPGSDAYGREYAAFKDLWREWAEANPSDFEALAIKVGNQEVYDAFHPADDSFSTGKALAELLTERYVDNSWIDLPRNTHETTLLDNQSILPMSSEDIQKTAWTSRVKGGQSMITIDGQMYKAVILKDNVKGADATTLSTIKNLGLEGEDNALAIMEDKYSFINDRHYHVSLARFYGELVEAKEVEPGTYARAIEASDVVVSPEFLEMTKKATAMYGLDTKMRIADTLDKTPSGTARIRDIKKVTNTDNVITELTENSIVMFHGSTLEDGNNPDKIRGLVEANRIFIDKAAAANAEILVGNENGTDEEIRSYIMSKYPKYVANSTGDGFMVGEYKVDTEGKEDITIWAAGSSTVGRFNNNNALNREGDKLTGAWGTITSTSSSDIEGPASKYRLVIDQDSVKNWEGLIDTGLFLDMIKDMGVISEPTSEFEKVRDTLIIKEQRYIKQLIAADMIVKRDTDERFYDAGDLESFIDELIEVDPVFKAEYVAKMDKVFNEDGTFKLSDVAAMSMGRNRMVTNSYVKESFPDMKSIWEHPFYKLLNQERVAEESTRSYSKLLNEPVISYFDMKILENAKGVTYRDAYNFLKTLGAGKVMARGKNISGHRVNQLMKANGIKAFKDGNNYVVIDNDAIVTNRNGKATMYDSQPTSKYVVSEAEQDLSKGNASIYNFLKRNNAVTIDQFTNEVRIKLYDESEYYDVKDSETRKELYTKVTMQVAKAHFSALEDVDVTEETLEAIVQSKGDTYKLLRNMVSNHISYGKGRNFFDNLFYRDAIDELAGDVNALVPGGVYAKDGLKTFVMKDSKGWFAQSTDGSLYRFFAGGWRTVDGVNNRKASSTAAQSYTFASPYGVGEVYDRLLTTNNEEIRGNFEVFEVSDENDYTMASEIYAKETESGADYRWDNFAKSWTRVNNTAITSGNFTPDTDVVTGQRVISIATSAGPILLSNGKAVNEKLITDDKGAYKKATDGLWTQSAIVGGLKDTKVKFQKEDASFTNTGGKVVSSMRVSAPVMQKAFQTLFGNTGIDAELLPASVIRAEYGSRYAEASGFVFNGKVIINSDKATLDTPLHEFAGHIYMAHLKSVDPQAFAMIIEKSLNHPIADQIRAKYPENSLEELGEEIFSTLMGLENQNKLSEQSLTIWQKIRKIANEASNIWDFFRSAFNEVFGNSSVEYTLDPNDSLLSIIDKIGDEVIFGDGSLMSTLTDFQRNELKTVINPTVSGVDIEAKLMKMGYIQKICS